MSLYEQVGCMDAAISLHTKYFQDKYDKYNLNRFCQSVAILDIMEIIDAITAELHTKENNNETCAKKDIYLKDLKLLLSLFFNTAYPMDNFRDGFIRDAYPILLELENNVVSIQNMNLVKIAEVYYTVTDETFLCSK